MSKLRLRVAFFVNCAIPAFRNNAVAISGPQHAGRHHPGLDEILRIFDRHVVADFIANTRESFDDVHVSGMQEAAAAGDVGMQRLMETTGEPDLSRRALDTLRSRVAAIQARL